MHTKREAVAAPRHVEPEKQCGLFFVPKPDGGLRCVIDYRQLNAITAKQRFPIPRVEDLFDKLQSASVFSSLDLQCGYYQLRLNENDVPKSAFTTPFGHFEYCPWACATVRRCFSHLWRARLRRIWTNSL